MEFSSTVKTRLLSRAARPEGTEGDPFIDNFFRDDISVLNEERSSVKGPTASHFPPQNVSIMRLAVAVAIPRLVRIDASGVLRGFNTRLGSLLTIGYTLILPTQ